MVRAEVEEALWVDLHVGEIVSISPSFEKPAIKFADLSELGLGGSLKCFSGLTKMFQKFLDGYFLMALASGHNGNRAFRARVFQLPVDDCWRRPDCHLWNQGNADACFHQRLNGRKLAAFKHNAGMKVVLVAKANHLISETVFFPQKNEFFRAQIVRENLPLFGKGMLGRNRQQHFFGKQCFGFKTIFPNRQTDDAKIQFARLNQLQ